LGWGVFGQVPGSGEVPNAGLPPTLARAYKGGGFTENSLPLIYC